MASSHYSHQHNQYTHHKSKSYTSENTDLPLSPQVLSHIRKVYLTLSSLVIAAALGTFFSTYVFQVPLLLASILSIGSFGCFRYIPQSPDTHRKRLGALLIFAFADGILTAPLVNIALQICANFAYQYNHDLGLYFASSAYSSSQGGMNVVSKALILTTCIFSSFTVSSLLAKRKSYLFLGGVLGTAMTGLFWVGLVSIFWRSSFLDNLMLYGGVVLFSFKIVYDTQGIIERAYQGDYDYLNHALMLLIDLVALFKRILIILVNKEQRKQRKANEKGSSQRGSTY